MELTTMFRIIINILVKMEELFR